MTGILPRFPRLARPRQRGSALIICLLLLVLLTLTGLSTYRTTILEERMAGNAADLNLAFQNAEATLRIAERRLQDQASKSACDDEFVILSDQTDGGENPPVGAQGQFDWLDSKKTNAVTDPLPGPPRYVVEELSVPVLEADSDLGKAQPFRLFRITARARGGSTSATVTLESLYQGPSGPCPLRP